MSEERDIPNGAIAALEALAQLFEDVPDDVEDDTPQEDEALSHAEHLLQIFDARNQGRDKELLELLNDAYRAKAEAEADNQ